MPAIIPVQAGSDDESSHDGTARHGQIHEPDLDFGEVVNDFELLRHGSRDGIKPGKDDGAIHEKEAKDGLKEKLDGAEGVAEGKLEFRLLTRAR